MALTLEQIARRSQGLGASEAAAAIGLGRFSRPIDVWRRKCGFQPDEQVSSAQERGNFLEDGMRRWYAARHRCRVALSDTLAHPEDPRILATPDGIASQGDGAAERWLVEIKVPGHWMAQEWGEPGSDQVPDDHLVQVTWGMAVAGLKRAEVIALIDGDLAVFRVPFDPQLFKEVRAAAIDFWERYVETRTEPPVDASDSYADYLGSKFRRVRDDIEVKTATRDQAAWVRRYQEARWRAKQAESDKRCAQNHLKSILGDVVGMESRYGLVTWKFNSPSSVVDWSALAREKGATEEDIRRHTKTNPGVRTMRVPEASAVVLDGLANGNGWKRRRASVPAGKKEKT